MKFNPWPLSGKGSLACHTYSDTRHSFIMVTAVGPWLSHLFLCIKHGADRFRPVAIGDRFFQTIFSLDCRHLFQYSNLQWFIWFALLNWSQERNDQVELIPVGYYVMALFSNVIGINDNTFVVFCFPSAQHRINK